MNLKTTVISSSEARKAMATHLSEHVRRAMSQGSGNLIHMVKDDLAALIDLLSAPDKDADRYIKLQNWMSSNVHEGWEEVERMGALAAWSSTEHMNDYLDSLPECNLGLCRKPKQDEVPLPKPKRVRPSMQDMVSRFLSWRLPVDFGPDSYVSFNRMGALDNDSWPIGTNLLTAVQAQNMLEHIIPPAFLHGLTSISETLKVSEGSDFIRRTNEDYASWCSSYYDQKPWTKEV